jgi:hypothetical protein
MSRFSLFVVRLALALLALLATVLGAAVGLLFGVPLDTVLAWSSGAIVGAWCVAPTHEDMAAFVALMSADD